MPGDWKLISFDKDGTPCSLYSEDDCASAIADGRLLPETRIEIDDKNGRWSSTAGDFNVIAHLFDPQPVPLQSALPAPAQKSHKAEPVHGDAAAQRDAPNATQLGTILAPQGMQQPEQSEMLEKPGFRTELPPIAPARLQQFAAIVAKNPWLAGILVLALLVGCAWLLVGGSRTEMWALRTTTIFVTTDPLQSSDNMLLRGESVYVEVVNPNWTKIASGRFQGGFVRSADLGANSPPLLDHLEAGQRRSPSEIAVVSAPDMSAPLLETIAARQSVNVIGAVLPSREWLEVNGSQGHIGYILAAKLSGAPQAKAPRAGPSAAPPRATQSTASPVRSVDKARASCPARTGWASCSARQMPEVAALDSQLQVAWREAVGRVGAGTAGLSPEEWRTRQDACAPSLACLSANYQRRIDDLNRLNPPAPPKVQFTPTDPVLQNRSRVIRGDDYPATAQRKGLEGVVGITVQVGADGKADSCTITASSGHDSLDDATCKLFRRRAKFVPARDNQGRNISGSFSTTIQWKLAQ